MFVDNNKACNNMKSNAILEMLHKEGSLLSDLVYQKHRDIKIIDYEINTTTKVNLNKSAVYHQYH
jgi:hypothetical protein